MERRELMQGFHLKIDPDFSLFVTLTKQSMNLFLFLILLRLFFCRGNGMLDDLADASNDYYDPWSEDLTEEEAVAYMILCTVTLVLVGTAIALPKMLDCCVDDNDW